MTRTTANCTKHVQTVSAVAAMMLPLFLLHVLLQLLPLLLLLLRIAGMILHHALLIYRKWILTIPRTIGNVVPNLGERT